jgi:hypothetical protein
LRVRIWSIVLSLLRDAVWANVRRGAAAANLCASRRQVRDDAVELRAEEAKVRRGAMLLLKALTALAAHRVGAAIALFVFERGGEWGCRSGDG